MYQVNDSQRLSQFLRPKNHYLVVTFAYADIFRILSESFGQDRLFLLLFEAFVPVSRLD